MSTEISRTVANLDIYMVPDAEAANGYRIEVVNPKYGRYMVGADSIKLQEKHFDLEIEIPDKDTLVRMAIETLKGKQRDIRVAAERDIMELQKKIEVFMMLPAPVEDQNIS